MAGVASTLRRAGIGPYPTRRHRRRPDREGAPRSSSRLRAAPYCRVQRRSQRLRTPTRPWGGKRYELARTRQGAADVARIKPVPAGNPGEEAPAAAWREHSPVASDRAQFEGDKWRERDLRWHYPAGRSATEKYKHAQDFGVDGNYNPQNVERFKHALKDFVDQPGPRK